MRILFVANTFPPAYTGGAEIASYHACRGLLRVGVDCSVLVLNSRASESLDEWYALDGIPVHRVVYGRLRNALTDVVDGRLYRVVRAELRHFRPDVVHVQNISGATLAPFLACRLAGVPVVNTLHDLWLLCPNNMLYRANGTFCDPKADSRTCRDCFRRYDFWGNIPFRRRVFATLTSNVRVFISPSQAVIDRHVEAGYKPERFRLIRLGFEETTTAQRQNAVLDRCGACLNSEPMILFAGGGVEIKGAKVVLEALPRLLASFDGLQVVVAGGGEPGLMAAFRSYAPAVQVLGSVPAADMHGLFAAADLTLVPSVWHENAPLVVCESFQAGTPVVGSAFGGIPELIRDGETGYLFSVGDAEAMVAAVRKHFARPAVERRRMRLRCAKEVQTRFVLSQHVERLRELYLEVSGC
jgi:glycosyltransferase involved in cell wall biosynthesis